MIINIADVHAAEKGKNVYLQICDPMNDFINSLSNSNYSGAKVCNCEAGDSWRK